MYAIVHMYQQHPSFLFLLAPFTGQERYAQLKKHLIFAQFISFCLLIILQAEPNPLTSVQNYIKKSKRTSIKHKNFKKFFEDYEANLIIACLVFSKVPLRTIYLSYPKELTNLYNEFYSSSFYPLSTLASLEEFSKFKIR